MVQSTQAFSYERRFPLLGPDHPLPHPKLSLLHVLLCRFLKGSLNALLVLQDFEE